MAIIKHFPKKVEILDKRNPDGGYYEAVCDVCERTYYPSSSKSKYCSSSCTQRGYRARKLEGKVKTRTKKAVKKVVKKPIVKAEKKPKITPPKTIKIVKKPSYKYYRTINSWELILENWLNKDLITVEEYSDYRINLDNMKEGDKIIIKDITVCFLDGKYCN